MINKLLHTPDGVRDLFGEECRRRRLLKERLHNAIASFGYTDIETPTFEFFDVFGKDVGTIPSSELYKFFDREGNTLALRPDFTPSMARAASRYFADDREPIRLCYQGSAFINHSSYRGRLKESTQIGAELMQDPSAEADAELIAMVITALKQSGLDEFQVSLGNVRFFEGLAEAAGLDEETALELRSLIRNKNGFGVRDLFHTRQKSGLMRNADNSGMNSAFHKNEEQLIHAFSEIPFLFGGAEVLDKANLLVEGIPQAMEAVGRLRTVLSILEEYELTRYVSIDLGMMSNYMYYTGIVFRAYTYGVGEAVVKGGRYDALLKHFGKDMPAVGFVIVVDQLQSALERQNCLADPGSPRTCVIYTREKRRDAIRLASKLRAEGKVVAIRLCEDLSEEINYIKEEYAGDPSWQLNKAGEDIIVYSCER